MGGANILTAIEVLRKLKAEVDVPIIAGGIHSTLYPEAVLNYGADIVMFGEGELTFVEVLQSVADNPLRPKLSTIPNLVYLNADGEQENHCRASRRGDQAMRIGRRVL